MLQLLGMTLLAGEDVDAHSEQSACAGRVVYPSGRAAANKTVQLVGPGARVIETTTDKEGNYRILPPDKGEYVLMLFEPQGGQLAHVKQLTGGTNQNVSLTLEQDPKNPNSMFSTLSAVEALTAYIVFQPPAQRPELAGRWREIMNSALKQVAAATGSLGSENEPRRRLIETKLASATQQLSVLNSPGVGVAGNVRL